MAILYPYPRGEKINLAAMHINPMFFALEGKFVVTEAQTTLLEYTQEERQAMPEAFTNRVRSWRRKRIRGLTS
jgi:hypothetical protein